MSESMFCYICVYVFLGPINREMRHLISSLQNHNHQLKGEVLRYKRKLREAQSDLSKVSKYIVEVWMLSVLSCSVSFSVKACKM